MGGVAEPYRQTDADLYVGELLRGRWLVWRYEDFGELDRLLCLGALEAHLAAAGIDPWIFDEPHKDVVIVAGKPKLPTFEQVESTIARIECDRILGRELGSELAVKTGRHR